MNDYKRKPNRLINFDYSANGLYFVTVCTKERIKYLSEIRAVGDAIPYKCSHSVNNIGGEDICE